jgi:leader peptidase (prepilin peptidase)/N-methyltransferase
VIEIFAAILAGLLIGSFLNVCIFRLPRDLSVVTPARSFCPSCEQTIAWYDNVPVLSYVVLGGRCRHCKTRISIRYPIVELTTAAAFGVCAAALGWTLPALKYSIFSAIMIALIATDLEERILPDEFTIGGTAIGLVLSAFVALPLGLAALVAPFAIGTRWLSVIESVIGASVVSGIFWGFGWAFEKIRHREGLGLGDVKMIAMIGAFLGLSATLLTLFVASLLGSVIGLTYILATRKKASEYHLPFGSFIGAAALVVAMLNGVVSVWMTKK